MKIIILKDVGNLTGRWHGGGGLVVIAKDLERAKEMFKRDDVSEAWRKFDDYDKYYIQPTEEEWEEAIIYDLKDDNAEEKYYVFPDAGCC